MICPSCRGNKTTLIHYHTAKPPHIWRNEPCKTCQGTGEMTEAEFNAHQARRAIHEQRSARRRSLYITMRELATAIGTDVGTYSRWESNGTENAELEAKVNAHLATIEAKQQPEPARPVHCEICRWASPTNYPSQFYCGFFAHKVRHNHTCEKFVK